MSESFEEWQDRYFNSETWDGEYQESDLVDMWNHQKDKYEKQLAGVETDLKNRVAQVHWKCIEIETLEKQLAEKDVRIKELESKLKGKDFVFQRALKDINILTNKLEVLTKCDYKTGLMGKEHHVYASCQGCKNKQLLEKGK